MIIASMNDVNTIQHRKYYTMFVEKVNYNLEGTYDFNINIFILRGLVYIVATKSQSNDFVQNNK